MFTEQEKQAAWDQIQANVVGPAFLEKLAELGHPVHTEAQAQNALQLAYSLASSGYRKQAAAPGRDKFAAALDAFNSLPDAGMDAGSYRLKQAATQLANNPGVYNAAMLLATAQHEETKAAQAAAAPAA